MKQIIRELYKLLADGTLKPKDQFKQEHPNYRTFYVDPLPAIPFQEKTRLSKDYKQLIQEHFLKTGRKLKPVNYRNDSKKPPEHVRCPTCGAPHGYIYLNNGKKNSQYLCKVCAHTFHSDLNRQRKTKFLCPYCNHALYRWKEFELQTIYKCPNDHCPKYLKEFNKLTAKERKIRNTYSPHFKLRYQHREYHYAIEQLEHSAPEKPRVNLRRIYHSQTTLGLILAFYVSFALSARKTALMLYMVFKIKISYQTILNYAEAAAFYCHAFNQKYKGTIDDTQAGDETYIKIMGKHNFVFLFMSARRKNITAYHVADTRSELPATISMLEAKRTARENQQITYITDGNPSYLAGLHFINSNFTSPASQHHKVVGLKNLDSVSKEYRPYKQIIERLNRTFKYHVRPGCGFKSFNGAVALTTLFVTYHNFLRPHQALNNKVPVPIQQLEYIDTIQARWAKILSMAYG